MSTPCHYREYIDPDTDTEEMFKAVMSSIRRSKLKIAKETKKMDERREELLMILQECGVPVSQTLLLNGIQCRWSQSKTKVAILRDKLLEQSVPISVINKATVGGEPTGRESVTVEAVRGKKKGGQ